MVSNSCCQPRSSFRYTVGKVSSKRHLSNLHILAVLERVSSPTGCITSFWFLQPNFCQAGRILRLQNCTNTIWECLRTKYDLLGYSTATLFMQIHCQGSLVIIYHLFRKTEIRKEVCPSHNWWNTINPEFQQLWPYTIGLLISLCLLSLYFWYFCIPAKCCFCVFLFRLG